MSKNQINSNVNAVPLVPGRRRGIPQESDNYAYHETQAKALKRQKVNEDAAQKKLHASYYAKVRDICGSNREKGCCPICGATVGKGIAGHVFVHVKRGEAEEWLLIKKSKTESILTISTEPI